MLKKLNNRPLLKGITLGAIFIFGTHLVLFLISELLLFGISVLFGLGMDPPQLKLLFLPQYWTLGLVVFLFFDLIFLLTKKMRDSIKLAPFLLGQLLIITALFFLYHGWTVDWTNPSEWFHITIDKTMVD